MKNTLFVASMLMAASTQAATLQFDDGVQVLSVNGQAVSARASSLPLDAGKQVVAVRYNQLHEFDVESHEFVRSNVHVVSFDATTSVKYHMPLPDMDVNEARDFAKQPVFTVNTPHHTDAVAVEVTQWSQQELIADIIHD